MRPLRDLVTTRYGLLLIAIVIVAPACRDGGKQEQPPSRPGTAPSPAGSFFPLAVGNSWTYRCSAEGEDQFEKTVKVVSETLVGGVRYFRVELTRAGDASPVVNYLFADAAGNVFESSRPSPGEASPVVTADLKPGERVGQLTAVAPEQLTTPATSTVTAVRVENFRRDDAGVSASRWLEWQGKFYVRGIGLVAEADGLGDECVLVRYTLAHR